MGYNRRDINYVWVYLIKGYIPNCIFLRKSPSWLRTRPEFYGGSLYIYTHTVYSWYHLPNISLLRSAALRRAAHSTTALPPAPEMAIVYPLVPGSRVVIEAYHWNRPKYDLIMFINWVFHTGLRKCFYRRIIFQVHLRAFNPFTLLLNVPQILKTRVHLQFWKISDWPIWIFIDPL